MHQIRDNHNYSDSTIYTLHPTNSATNLTLITTRFNITAHVVTTFPNSTIRYAKGAQ